MNLQCRIEIASAYKSRSQVARSVSEDWCARELYCPACDSDRLSPSTANTPAFDFACPLCAQLFQLKSSRSWNLKKVVDAGYEAMMRAIRADKTPNLLLLQYSPNSFVTNLLLVPGAFLTENVIEKRRPLSFQARRAGWVGCNILLRQIPDDGKIAIVSASAAIPVRNVRAEFSRVRRLGELPPSLRGWTVDILNRIRQLGKTQFSLDELYEFESELRALHPQNRHVRPKIRQQLQIVRDMGVIYFTRPGKYSLRS